MLKLGKKQNVKNDDWLKTIENIEMLVSKEELNKLEHETIAQIKKTIIGKKVAYSWSGGKDSIVLGAICEKAGVDECVFATSNLEYPAFEKWVNENKPKNLQVINTGQGVEWLAKNQHMLFPQDSKVAAKWFQIIQHKAQTRYFKEQELDMILLGRRKADGNYVGRGTNVYTNANGVTRYSPLSDWTHEHILAYIHYYKLPVPPIYDWKNGYLCGTHTWAARQWTGNIENGWKEVYEIDKTIVEKAADKIQSARKFLDSI